MKVLLLLSAREVCSCHFESESIRCQSSENHVLPNKKEKLYRPDTTSQGAPATPSACCTLYCSGELWKTAETQVLLPQRSDSGNLCFISSLGVCYMQSGWRTTDSEVFENSKVTGCNYNTTRMTPTGSDPPTSSHTFTSPFWHFLSYI